MINLGLEEEFELNRRQLEGLIGDKIQKTMEITERAMQEANLTVEQINEVII